MNEFLQTKKANSVYDLLVELAGANESDRQDFVYNHCSGENGCSEWRFCGHFGFGGKYRSQRNIISYYIEDTTDSREALKKDINNRLSEIY
jgi:hypothetical protein